MKKLNPYKCLTLGLAAAIAVIAGGGAMNDAEAKPPKDTLMVMGMLEAAKGQIWRAPKDKDGHRTKALEATKKALEEVRSMAFGKDSNKLPWPK